MKNIILVSLLLGSPIMADYKFTVLFNNIPMDNSDCTPAWGFACYVECPDMNILFDTGSDGDVLIDNMRKSNVSIKDIDCIFISHMHYDHVGGLEKVLNQSKRVKLYLPSSAPGATVDSLKTRGIDITLIRDPVKITDNVYSTGELNNRGIREQSLAINTRQGVVVITGCAHPGVVRITEKAKEVLDEKIYLVFGGFHMAGMSEPQITETIEQMQALSVEKIGPSHCTGDEAMEAFKKAWGDRFVDLGCGATLEIR